MDFLDELFKYDNNTEISGLTEELLLLLVPYMRLIYFIII